MGYEFPTLMEIRVKNLGKIVHNLLTSPFTFRIPHYFGMKVPPLIRNSKEIREKMALLEALGDIQAALSVLGQPSDSDLHPVDQQYFNLKCELTLLDRESGDFKVRIHPPFIMK